MAWFRALLLLAAGVVAEQDFTQYVDVFYGTENGGNMFPGVVGAPFAAVKLGPDLDAGDAAKSGYMASGNVFGFSMMHETGTGGSPKYGTISQMPILSENTNSTLNGVSRATKDLGSVGYYKTSLSNGVTVELGGTSHAGMFQYTFPKGQAANIMVDVSHYLPSTRPGNFSQSYSNGDIELFPDGHYEGYGAYYGGWNLSPEWKVYFCGNFSQESLSPQTFAIRGNNVVTNPVNMTDNKQTRISGKERLGMFFSFGQEKVISRVGMSFISSKKACHYLNTEIPSGTTLDQLVQKSKDAWNSQVLSKIQTTEKDSTFLGQLYTNMYGMFILPSNRTGENPNRSWSPTIPYYDDLYTLWDLYRCTTPLWHILQPQMYTEFLRSIVEVARVDGFLPDGRSSNFNGRAQGGSSADNVLADAYVKGVKIMPYNASRHSESWWNQAYYYMVKNAELTPVNNRDPSAPDSSTQHGRGALPDWHKLGYITTRFTRSVSRAVEYSGNDFAVSQVAAGLGKHEDARKYLARSRNWRNHWNPDVQSYGGITGFLMPLNPDGTWVGNVDPSNCGGCYWGDAYYEATPWQYTLNVPHDIGALIRMSGGEEAFSDRLTMTLSPTQSNPGSPLPSPLVDFGNEPSFGTTYLWNWLGAQDQSVAATRSLAQRLYKPGSSGLPGNSDAGAMQSWWIWAVLGLYPVTGQNLFLIGSPWTANTTISLGGGKSLSILSNSSPNSQNQYIRSVALNGKPIVNNWLTYDDLFTGKNTTLEFVMTNSPVGWDSKGVPPPSPASGSNITGSAAALLLQSAKASRDLAIGVAVGSVVLGIFVVLCAALIVCWRKRKAGPLGIMGLGRARGKDIEKNSTGKKSPQIPEKEKKEEQNVERQRVFDDDEKTLTGDMEAEHHEHAPVDEVSPSEHVERR